MERSEAIEIVRKNCLCEGKETLEALRVLIPELKESEDERIKKAIFQALSKKDAREVLLANGLQVSDALAWLEKQGSQNLANSAKTCKVEHNPTLPDFEEQEGVAGRDYIPVEWVEAIRITASGR